MSPKPRPRIEIDHRSHALGKVTAGGWLTLCGKGSSNGAVVSDNPLPDSIPTCADCARLEAEQNEKLAGEGVE